MPQKTIHIFKAGQHTAMQGESLAFSESDLAACAAAYNPDLHEAPLVVGHPAADAPAFGWVHSLSATPEGLFAAPLQVEPAFAEAVSQGRYKKVSASFYKPESAANPVPGVFYLRHVGFLGAQPPAVKGLKSVHFADTDADCFTVEFSEADTTSIMRRMAGLFRGLRDWIIEKDGLEAADKVIPSWTADWIQEDTAIAAAQNTEIPAFSEKEKAMPNSISPNIPETPESPAPVEQQDYSAKLEELQGQLASFAEKERHTRAQSLVDKALSEGRLTPAQSAGLVSFMTSLSETDTLSFGEGDTAQSLPPFTYMSHFLNSLPVQVDFSEHSKDIHGQVDGLPVAEAAQAALCYQESLRKKGITVTITDAVDAVKAGKHKEHGHG